MLYLQIFDKFYLHLKFMKFCNTYLTNLDRLILTRKMKNAYNILVGKPEGKLSL